MWWHGLSCGVYFIYILVFFQTCVFVGYYIYIVVNNGELEKWRMAKPPVRYIVFQKTHKCSSTTIQNILLRYAMNHDLVLVLPKDGIHLSQSTKFNSMFIQDSEWYQVHILQHNIVYFYKAWYFIKCERFVIRLDYNLIYFAYIIDGMVKKLLNCFIIENLITFPYSGTT